MEVRLNRPDLISEVVKPLERDLGLSEGFFVDLQAEDDWSFIVKGHAFLEAVFSHVLARALEKKELKSVLTHLELGDTRSGKIAFAEALGLLSSRERRFVRWLSRLRNRVVHDVTQTRFDIDTYISNLDQNQRRSFVEAVNLSTGREEVAADAVEVDASRFALQSPKEAIWAAIMAISGIMYFGPKFPMILVLLILLQAWVKSASWENASGSAASPSA
jgi:hypothetical protein